MGSLCRMSTSATEGKKLRSQLMRMDQGCGENKLQNMAMNAIAHGLQDKEIEELKNLFISLDDNGDGQLTMEEITSGLGKLGMEGMGARMLKIMEECDTDGNGVIDYTEFLAATLDRKRVIQRDVCWNAFRVFDKDGSGKIDTDELIAVLASDEVKDVMAVTDEMVPQILKDADANGDGEIDFDEFMEMMKKGAGG